MPIMKFISLDFQHIYTTEVMVFGDSFIRNKIKVFLIFIDIFYGLKKINLLIV